MEGGGGSHVVHPPTHPPTHSSGRFIPQKFEDLFVKWDHEGKGGLSFRDLW